MKRTMKRTVFLLLCLLMLCAAAVASCHQQKKEAGEGELQLQIYCLRMDGEKKQPRGLAAEEVTMPQGENIQETVEDILLKIKQVSGGGKAAAIPAGVTVNEVAFYGNSVIVSLSSTFDELPEVEKSLAAAAIALTLTQLDSIDYVKVSCATDSYNASNDFYLNGDNVILDESSIQFNTFDITLYLVNTQTDQLEEVVRTLKTEEDQVYLNGVFSELVRQPEEENLQSPVPQGMMLRRLSSENGVCELDFLEIGAEKVKELDELSVQAIVKTMCAQDGVRGVLLRIDGKPLSEYGLEGYDDVLTCEK